MNGPHKNFPIAFTVRRQVDAGECETCGAPEREWVRRKIGTYLHWELAEPWQVRNQEWRQAQYTRLNDDGICQVCALAAQRPELFRRNGE